MPNVGEYFEVVRKIAIAQSKAFKADFIASKVVGTEVPHAHIWILPSYSTEGNQKDFEGNAKKIVDNL